MEEQKKIIPFPKQNDDYFTVTLFDEYSYRIKTEYKDKFLALVDSLLRHLEKKSAEEEVTTS